MTRKKVATAMAQTKTSVKAESKYGHCFSFPLQQMMAPGLALVLAGAGKRFKTSSRPSERQNDFN